MEANLSTRAIAATANNFEQILQMKLRVLQHPRNLPHHLAAGHSTWQHLVRLRIPDIVTQ